MADASHGGVIYYFCHIHSKMSGKLIIKKANGDPLTGLANPTAMTLYSPVIPSQEDETCGTSGIADYVGGASKVCDQLFLCGVLTTNWEKCLQAIDCKMNKEMKAQTCADYPNKLAVFMQQMIAHHLNAVNMARMLLKQASTEITACDVEDTGACDGWTAILWGIVNEQNYQVHKFRAYLVSIVNVVVDAAGDVVCTPVTPALSGASGSEVLHFRLALVIAALSAVASAIRS